jgi:hypothetical protein
MVQNCFPFNNCFQVTVVEDSLVKLDDWIDLRMEASLAACVVALRPALDALLVRVAQNPAAAAQPTELVCLQYMARLDLRERGFDSPPCET